jgi:hypothetical protein
VVLAMNRRVVLLAWAVLLVTGRPAPAREPDDLEELRFVRELRARHYHDLALAYLERLQRAKPSAELAAELPLETARTLLEGAEEEPDSGKRLALYGQAQAVFAEFLAKSPKDPRAGEVHYDLAQVAVQHGRTQLSRALLQDSAAGRTAEMRQARARLEKAGELLAAAQTAMDADLAKLHGPNSDTDRARKKKLEEARARAELDQGVNLLDVAQTFDEARLEEKQARARKVEAAVKILEKIAGGDAANPVTWQARAWVGRCYFELGDPRKAQAKLLEVVNADRQPAAAEGQRLARYFRLLVMKENPEPKETATELMDAGARWLAAYPGHLHTPEGYGVRFLLARVYVEQAELLKPKTGTLTVEQQQKRAKYLADARKLLKEVEQTENDFTDRARRLKVRLIADQGGFNAKVPDLQTFEACYVRAQYEVIQMGTDARDVEDPKEREARRRRRLDTVILALERGLGLKDANNKELTREANTARAMLAYYLLNAGRYREAVQVGETFARGSPRAGQAAQAAAYALQAYAQLLAQKEAQFATPEELQTDRGGMRQLAEYMEQHWPAELAGDVARHQIGLSLLRERKVPEALQTLARVTPSYPSYAFAQYQLAEVALEAEKARLEPIPGDKPGDYRRRAVVALASIPDPAGPDDPAANRVYALAKSQLARELFRDKKFKEMDELARHLLGQVAALPFDDDRAQSEALRKQLTADATELQLYARYGLAEARMAAGNHAEVAALLDGAVVDRMKDGKLVQAQRNLPLATALLSMDLRANVQLGKIDRALVAIEALQSLSEGDAGSLTLLRQLGALIRNQVEELTKKGDRENLQKARAGFASLLAKLTEKQGQPTPEFVLLLAQNYSALEEYGQAIEQLGQLPAPKPGVPNPDDNEKVLRAARILLIRDLRLNQEVAKANSLLNEIMGPQDRREWGAKNVDVLLEKVHLLEEAKAYDQAAALANNLVKQLQPRADNDNVMKERYLEFYYHVAYCFVKHGQGLSDRAKAAQHVRDAAVQIVELEKKWAGFGSDASAKRFQELLEQEPELKAQYDKLKAKQ